MKKIPLLVGFSLVTALSGFALAGGGGKKMDANQDGKVSVDEAVNAAKQKFAKHDADKNGAISGDEAKGRGQRRFERADANKDGRVTWAEMEAKVRTWFKERDANKDGFLTGDEFGRGKHKHKDGHAQRPGRGGRA